MDASPLRSALMTAAILIALVAAVVVFGTTLSGGNQRVITDALVKLVIVVGMYIFIGNSGVLSFGHIAFLGLGAYTAAWLTIAPATKASLMPGLPSLLIAAEVSPPVAVVAGGLLAAAVALLVGLPLTRLAGIAASIGTFAMLVVFYVLFANWTGVTGGQGSLYGLPIFTNLVTAGALAAIAILIAALHKASPSGFRLRGSREDPIAAQSCGIDIRRERLVAFVLSAFVVGMAGAMHAYFLQVVVANEFYLKLTFITVAMIVIGGTRSLTGAVAGTALVAVVSELLRRTERGIDLGGFVIGGRPGLQEVGLAVVMLLVLLFRRQGIVGSWEIGFPVRSRAESKETGGGRK